MIWTISNEEGAKTKEKEKDWFQIVIANISGLHGLIAGLLFAWASPAIPILISEDGGYNFTLEQCSYIPVISSLTVMLFSAVPGKMVDKIGRKPSLLILSAITIAICLIYAFAKNIYLFYFARVLNGLADATLFATLPVYLGEVLTPKVRGVWGNAMSVQIYLGQFLVNVIGGYLNIQVTAFIILSVPLLFLCLYPILPESPYYHMIKGRHEEARTVLRKLRRVQNVEDELEEIQIAVKRQLSEPASWSDLFTVTSNRKGVIAIVFLRLAQQASGFAAISVYTKYIFEQTAGSFTATESSIIFTGVLLISCVIGSSLMDKLGRRAALMSSISGLTLVLIGETIYFFIDMYFPEVDLSRVRFIPLVLFVIYVFVWSMGLAIVPNLMLGELFSANIKRKGLCAANIALGLGVSVTSKIFQLLEVNFGMWCPFGFFAICSCVCLAISNLIVPETRRKTLEEIQLSLKMGKIRSKSTASTITAKSTK